MIPRYQRILFTVLLVASLGMGALLWWQLDRAHERLLKGEDSAPTSAPQVTPAEPATLLVASDEENTLMPQTLSLPLPVDAGSRLRAILGKLLDLYAAEGSPHPAPGGDSAVLQVFLVAAPDAPAPSSAKALPAKIAPPQDGIPAGPLMAVVNLSSGFAANHPSGIGTETLTVLSIAGTLHANLPRIVQVRFLVDGRPRATLAGHADLSRAYLASDAPAAQ